MSISTSARDGVNRIFTRAARTTLVLAPADAIEISPLPGQAYREMPEKHVLVLTISSYLFRLLTIIHYDADPATDAYFNRSATGRTLGDAFGEVGNLCCGAMKREFGNHFMHLGMSTPYMLDSRCMAFLNELKPSLVSQYAIRINHRIELHATLCLCAYGAIDFAVGAEVEVESETTGALEIF